MGLKVAKVAHALGQPLMPWQRHVADVAGEVDARGRYVHPLVVVSVQRQAGKSTLMLAQAAHRCLQGPNRRVWFTAQTGSDARDRFREFVALVMSSPLRDAVQGRPRMAAGSECLTFVNGSTLRPHPPTKDALHGKQGDHNDIDEGWSFDEEHGSDLLQAIAPTQATRPGAQTFVWSTRGDASSTWFHRLIDRGYNAEGVALFDWGIPFDADPTDDAVIAAHHPAVGHVIAPETLVSARAVIPDPAEYGRAYGNVASGGRETVIPAAFWTSARTQELLPAGQPAYGIGVSRGGEYGSLFAVVADAEGRPWLELVERRPGRSWLVERVKELNTYGGGVAVRRGGPSAPVADALEIAGVPLLTPNSIDYAAGCQDLFDRVTDLDGPRLFHRGPPEGGTDLDIAVDVAGRRKLEEGGWVWSAKYSGGHIDALEGATLASWAVARAPVPVTIGRAFFR